MIEKIKSLFVKKEKEKTLGAYNMGFPVAPREEIDLRNAAFKNWSGACINVRARNTGNVRLYFEDNNGQEVTTFFSPLFVNPNISFSVSSFMFALSQYLDYSGNVYIWFPKFGTSVISQMWLLPTSNCVATFGTYGLEYIELFTGKGIIKIDGSEICHVKTMAMSHTMDEYATFLGQPIELNSCIDAIYSDYEKTLFLKRYFERDGTPPLFINSDQTFTDSTAAQFISRLKQQLPRGYILTAVLDGNKQMNTLPIGESLLSGTASDEIRQLICINFGVSEPLLTQNHQNKATADSVKSVFFENTIEPRIKLITESITQYLQKNGLDVNIKLAYEDSNFYDETLWNQKLEFAFMNNIISPQTYLSLADFPSNLSEEYDKELSKITAISANGITENSIPSPTTDEQQNTEQI
jgi:hypothetical protein